MATKLQYNPLSGRMEEVDINDFVYKFRGENTPTVDTTQAVSPVIKTNLDNGGLASEGWGDKFSRWFTPNEKGTSLGGQVLSGIGTGVDAASGLAGLYFAQKNFDLAKEAADLEKKKQKSLMARQAKVDQAGVDLSKNVGNGASYSYKTTI